jgi:hypothetical protein
LACGCNRNVLIDKNCKTNFPSELCIFEIDPVLYMKVMNYKTAIILSGLAMCATACGDEHHEFPRTSFNAPFPKRNIDLSTILGEEISIKRGADTLVFSVQASADKNIILTKKIRTPFSEERFAGTAGSFFSVSKSTTPHTGSMPSG